MWARRRTWIGGRSHDDDWIVLRNGLPVGRVMLQQLQNPQRRVWCWFKQVGYGRQAQAQTLDAALNALRAAVLADDADHPAGSMSSGPSSGMPNR